MNVLKGTRVEVIKSPYHDVKPGTISTIANVVDRWREGDPENKSTRYLYYLGEEVPHRAFYGYELRVLEGGE